MFLKKSIPALYAGLGIFLPLITTNCAVMGVCVLNIDKEYGPSSGTGDLLHMPPASGWP
jgi:Na+-translocating ferredoxin:NAD+ oxidoreductase RnfA subunit